MHLPIALSTSTNLRTVCFVARLFYLREKLMSPKNVQIGSLNLTRETGEKLRTGKQKKFVTQTENYAFFPPNLYLNPCFVLMSITLSNKQSSDRWLVGLFVFVMRLAQRAQKHVQTRSLNMAVFCVSMRMR